jgi:hypothetical protein
MALMALTTASPLVYEQDLPVLTKHAINEPAGDRILVLCETPHADRLRELQQDWDTLR